MRPHRVKDLLAGDVELGTTVRIQGWVRTSRSSKNGLSFVAVSDGTCFSPMQVVAKADLANYSDEVAKLGTGCSVDVVGTLVESKGKGQSCEIQALSLIHI